MNENLPPLELYPSPRKLYFTLVYAGVLLGMMLAQLVFMLFGKVGVGVNGILFMFSLWSLVSGWRMVSTLPWGAINDKSRFEYRNPYGPFKTVSEGGEKDAQPIPSRTPEAHDDLER